MKRKFILVETTDKECHIVPIDQIKYVAPKRDHGFKSKIVLIDDKESFLYCVETQKDIYDKIIIANTN